MAAEFISSPEVHPQTMKKTLPSENTLWPFALACYARPDVEAACLELQAAGADICLLLTAAWLEQRAVGHTPERQAQLWTTASSWQRDVVQPLRKLRQGWREQAAADTALHGLRERVKQLELDAERTLLERLETVTEPWPKEEKSSDWLGPLCRTLPLPNQGLLQVLRDAAQAA